MTRTYTPVDNLLLDHIKEKALLDIIYLYEHKLKFKNTIETINNHIKYNDADIYSQESEIIIGIDIVFYYFNQKNKLFVGTLLDERLMKRTIISTDVVNKTKVDVILDLYKLIGPM
jgi:hypothetical protein